jgi:membrane peptidoglycan carboxypeptidase
VTLAALTLIATAWFASPTPTTLATSVQNRLHATAGAPVDPAAIPPIMRDAVVATEDERFYRPPRHRLTRCVRLALRASPFAR